MKSNKFVKLFVAFMTTFGFLFSGSGVYAHQSPAACTSNDFVLTLGQSDTVVYDETSPFGATTITYTVSTGNPNTSGSGCDIGNVDVNLTTPDGVVHNMESGGSYAIGTATAVLGTVNYDADSADKSGSFLIASVNAQGDLHDNPLGEDPQNITKQVSALVINPSTVTSITSSANQVIAGGTVDLTVTEENNGDVDLINPSVDVDNGVGTLSAPPDAGDDGDGILEPGETWSWTVSGIVINADTTFTATGHGEDPLGGDISSENGFETEEDSIAVDVVNPTTITTINTSATQVLSGGTVDLTVTEENDGDVDLTNAYVDVDNGVGTLSAPPTSGDDGDEVLEPGETWSWTVLGVVVNSDTTFTATGHGTDPFGNDVTFPDDEDEQDAVTVEVLNPTTVIGISASSTLVVAGTNVTLTITEENDGNADLTGVYVDVDNGVGTLDTTSANFSGDDGDGILEPGETWQWLVDVTINALITYTATGHGTDPFGNDITYPDDPEEQASVTIEVEVLSCTLTQGYWKTHSDQGPAPYDSEGWGALGDYDGDGTEEEEGETLAFGMTWYDVFQTAPKGGNVWYQLAHQYMAAYLNMQSGASVPSDVSDALTDAKDWLETVDPTGNPKAKDYPDAGGWASLLASYNEGGIGPGHCEE